MTNVRLITSPFALVKHDVQGDKVDFIWPKEMQIQFEENEELDFQNDGKLYTSKWIEDPDYREEIIIRDVKTGGNSWEKSRIFAKNVRWVCVEDD